MRRTHLTNACDHPEDAWCRHCEDGCRDCGKLTDLNDSSRCYDCAVEHRAFVADCQYDQMRDDALTREDT
jgi:hypothetical protein